MSSGGPASSHGGPPDRQIELILQRVDALPTLSPIAQRLLGAGSSDDFDIDEVSGLIESDPALTARILAMCRTADKGLGDRITTVRRAMVMLGIRAVRSAVLSVAVYDMMESVAQRAHDDAQQRGVDSDVSFDRVGFWTHSLGVACASRLLAEKGGKKVDVSPDDAFVAGLLHDIGKLVLDVALPTSFVKVLMVAAQQRSAAAPIERKIIGVDHHVAGKRVAERWGLPRPLQDVMWLHGQPFEALPDVPHRRLVALVSVAKAVCRGLHLGWSGEFDDAREIDREAEKAGIDRRVLGEVVRLLPDAVAERRRIMGLGEEASPQLLLRSIFNANRELGRMNEAISRESAAAARSRAALDAVGGFLERVGSATPLVSVFGLAAASASTALGGRAFAVVSQIDERSGWSMHRVSMDGRVMASETIDPPAVLGGESLADVLRGEGGAERAMSLLPWMADQIAEGADYRRVRAIPASPTPEGADGPGVLILHESAAGAKAPPREVLRALRSAWAAAIASVWARERSDRLGEELVEANRRLSEAQARLTETESMARLGEMTAGAAHEMNNPLTVISARAQMLRRKLREAEHTEAADAIVSAAQDLTDLISCLNLLADPPEPACVWTSVEDILTDAAKAGGSKAGASGRVRVQRPDSRTQVDVDAQMLTDALTELVVNALEAPESEIVSIRAETSALDGRLVFRVEDRGAGLSPRAMRHAFDPFFSEKPAGRKRGLGLARARRLADLHAGGVVLAPREGGGTVASLWLPAKRVRGGMIEAA